MNGSAFHSQPFAVNSNVTAASMVNTHGSLLIRKRWRGAILTMVERKTNMFLQSKMTSKKPDVVAMAAWRLLLPYKNHVHTITTDNGIEFMNHVWLARRIGATVYFADPYFSGQKGAVKNANQLL